MSKWQDVTGKLKSAQLISSKAAVSDPDAPHTLERPPYNYVFLHAGTVPTENTP